MHCKNKILLIAIVLLSMTKISHAQKKNSVTLHSGLVNLFYDDEMIIMNTSSIKNTSRPSYFFNSILIKSVGVSYLRRIGKKDGLAAEYDLFIGAYLKHNQVPLIGDPKIQYRKWNILSGKYERNIVEKDKFRFNASAGLISRFGYEYYHVFSKESFIINGEQGYEGVSHAIKKTDLGFVCDVNIKLNIWKELYFYSRFDTEFYILDLAKNDFNEMTEKYPSRNFTKTFPINHSLVVGFGWDF